MELSYIKAESMTAAAAQLDNVLKTAPTSEINNNRETLHERRSAALELAERGRATAQKCSFVVGTGKISKSILKNTIKL